MSLDNPSVYLKDGRYDVGRIVRDIRGAFTGGEPPKTSRLDMLAMIGLLERFSADLPVAGSAESIRADAESWRSRLAEYRRTAEAAPSGPSQALAHEVVGPLLLGWYDGGAAQRTADIATPFVIANQLEVDRTWRRERLRLLWSDLEARGKDVAGAGVSWLAVAAGVAAAIYFGGGRD